MGLPFYVTALLTAIVLFLTGTIMYVVKTVKENTGEHVATSKKAPLIVLTVGIAFDLVIFLTVVVGVLTLVFKL